MRPEPGFLDMRARLVARGLLTGDFRLTAAGQAHAEALIERLQHEEAAPASRPAVRWNTGRPKR